VETSGSVGFNLNLEEGPEARVRIELEGRAVHNVNLLREGSWRCHSEPAKSAATSDPELRLLRSQPELVLTVAMRRGASVLTVRSLVRVENKLDVPVELLVSARLGDSLAPAGDPSHRLSPSRHSDDHIVSGSPTAHSSVSRMIQLGPGLAAHVPYHMVIEGRLYVRLNGSAWSEAIPFAKATSSKRRFVLNMPRDPGQPALVACLSTTPGQSADLAVESSVTLANELPVAVEFTLLLTDKER
jgi:hypothetical protein